MLIGVVVSEILANHKSAFLLYITDNGNFGVAHALYHVILRLCYTHAVQPYLVQRPAKCPLLQSTVVF